MTTKTSIGGAYPVQAPLLTDNANVIEAIRLYHLGEGGTEGSPSSDSITNHLSIKANIASPTFTGTITSPNVVATANVNAVTVNATTNVVTVTVNATVVNATTSVNTATVNTTTANVTTLNVTNINGGAISSATTATTQAVTDSSTKIATTKFVKDSISASNFGYKTGQWYFIKEGIVDSSQAFSTGALHFMPITIRSNVTIGNIAVYQQDSPTSNIIFALYTDNNFYPGTKFADLGTISGTTVGPKYRNGLSVVVPAGNYWVCAYLDNANSYTAYQVIDQGGADLDIGAAAAFDTPFIGGYMMPTGFTTYPTSFSSIAYTGSNFIQMRKFPGVQFRYV